MTEFRPVGREAVPTHREHHISKVTYSPVDLAVSTQARCISTATKPSNPTDHNVVALKEHNPEAALEINKTLKGEIGIFSNAAAFFRHLFARHLTGKDKKFCDQVARQATNFIADSAVRSFLYNKVYEAVGTGLKHSEIVPGDFKVASLTIRDHLQDKYLSALTTLKTDYLWHFPHEQIAEGAAKRVWQHNVEWRKVPDERIDEVRSTVLYTAKKGKEDELRQEVQTAQDIRQALDRKAELDFRQHLESEFILDGGSFDRLMLKYGTPQALVNLTLQDLQDATGDDEIDLLEPMLPQIKEAAEVVQPLGEHLAIDLQEVGKDEQVKGKYTVRTEKAWGSLDKKIDYLTEKERASVARQVMEGIGELHAAGFVHGDLKPDNILLYKRKDGSIHVKIADLGKTKPIGSNAHRRMSGNPRWLAPEGRLSQKGEAWSAAQLYIYVMERPYINSSNPMLVELDPNKARSNTTPKRTGIERYILSNSSYPQMDNYLSFGEIKRFNQNNIRSIESAFTRKGYLSGPPEAEKASELYIDAYTLRLGKNLPKDRKTILEDYGDYLKKQSSSDPTKRDSAEVASQRIAEFHKALGLEHS